MLQMCSTYGGELINEDEDEDSVLRGGCPETTTSATGTRADARDASQHRFFASTPTRIPP